MRLIATVALAALSSLALLAGCSTTTTTTPTASGTAGGITITDQAGRTVTLKATATKVFGAGPPATTLLYSLDPTIMAGWNTALSAAQKPYVTKDSLSWPILGRLTGGKDSFNPEVLNANKVDLIVDAGDINANFIATDNDLQAKTGIPVIMLSTDPAKMAEGYQILGKVTGKTDAASTLAAETKRITDALAAGAAKVPAGTEASVLYSVGAKGLQTAQSGSINVRPIEVIGAKNVAGTTKKSGTVEVTAEQVLAYNPDWVIISPDTPTDAIATNPASVPPVGSLKAITSGHYLVVPTNVPFGWFSPPSVNQLLGMMWAAKSIYPGQYDFDLTKETVSFYKNFFHYDLSEDDAKKMLATAHTPGA